MKKGTIVQLKSGGPLMTVIGYQRDVTNQGNPIPNMLECQWFFENEIKTKVFESESLKVVEDEK